MLVIPAIDLKDGRCVRLRQGDLQRETVYSDDPPAMAGRWEAQGARWLHLVDLNGAVDGTPKNQSAIEAIVRAVSVPVQVGGGIRTVETISRYLSIGVARVVLGTAVLEQRTLLDEACSRIASWSGSTRGTDRSRCVAGPASQRRPRMTCWRN